jgi:hypothetical protein
MPEFRQISRVLVLVATCALFSSAQKASSAEVHAKLAYPKNMERHTAPSAVLWLQPLEPDPDLAFVPTRHYTLLQKNRMFRPHLLVIPVGSVVEFPNHDTFFHNVFSLFDGKRFDLGLYEAGSTKSVTFSREGVSYIFCNIHPEMSAVVLTLSSKLFSVADSTHAFSIQGVPAGDYDMHLWIEGAPQPALNAMTRRVHISGVSVNLGSLEIPPGLLRTSPHTNMYGQRYDPDTTQPY